MFSQCLCPENIEGLKPVRINESFYKIIPPRAKIADQKIRGINQFITRAIGPLVKVFETLRKIEGEHTSLDSPNVKLSESSEVNIKQMRIWMGQSLKLLSFSNSILLQCHKNNFKSFLDCKYHYLTRESNPITEGLLFGNEVKKSIEESSKVMEMAKKVRKYQSRDFRPRGRAFSHAIASSRRTGNFTGFTRPYNCQQHFNSYRGMRRDNKTFRRLNQFANFRSQNNCRPRG